MKKYAFFLVVGVSAASFAALLIRFSGEHPLVISFYRMLLASLIVMPFMLMELKKTRIPLKTLLGLVGVGGILSIHFALWNFAVPITTVASATILVCAHPLFVVPLGQRSSGEALHRGALAGVAIAFVGIVILSMGGLGDGNIIGDMLALGGGVMAGLYIMAGRKARSGGLGLFTYVGVVYLSCAMFTLLAIVAMGEFTTNISADEWLVFLALALVPTILGHTMINASLKEIKSGIVSTAILVEPLGATILAAAILYEVPSSLTLVGGLITLFGVWLVVWRK
ncbi:MAG: DMT family transporter [Candidatus Thermoplasmatota archaeon]|nr:DMT family transporter [Candidatus Thermoplasmatota archaeon]